MPAVSKTPEEAKELLGFIGMVLSMGGSSSNAQTRESLDWTPTHPGLIEDLEQGTYSMSEYFDI